ncbi:MAG: prepilin-type N-terminal cleavage/methylation domain-containing protein [Fuerstiella sp.]
MKSQYSLTPNKSSRRQGVTLIEVLMSLMIMSIGISAVAVLFPISVLRSIQATQLTNGAIVKHNVEAILDARPDLIFDPDGDGDLDEHFRSAASRNYVVDPTGFYTNLADFGTTLAGEQNFGNAVVNGVYGTSTPIQRFGGAVPLSNGVVFDPTLGPSQMALDAWRLAALDLANQGDGWDTVRDLTPAALGTGFVQFSSDEDLSDIPTTVTALPSDGAGGYLIADPGLYRMILISENGKFSQPVPLVALINTATDPNRCYFSEDVNGNGTLDNNEDVNMSRTLDARTIPVEFRVDLDLDGIKEAGEEVVSRVIIQSRKISDYSWILNVRRRGDGLVRNIDVVVRFNNGVSAQDEKLYEAAVVAGSRFVWVRLPSRADASDSVEPPLQKGGYLFDTANGKWRRVRDVQEAPLFPSGTFANFDYLVTVEEPIGTTEGAGSLDAAGPFTPVMVPTGVVDVYPMGSRSIPASLAARQF